MALTATREPSAAAEMCAKITGVRCPLSQGNREEGRALLYQQGGLPGGRGAPGCKAAGQGGVTGRWRRASPGALLLGGSVAALLAASASPRPRAVLRSWKPFLMSASRASMTHTSSCFPPPLLAEEPRDPQGHCPGSPEPLRERGGGKAAAQTGWPPAARPRAASPAFPPSPRGLWASSSASCCFLRSALAACSFRSLFSCTTGTARDPRPPAPQIRPPCSGTAGAANPPHLLPHTFRARRKRSRKVFMVLSVSSRDSCWASSHR